jgi:trehalose 6-phosphate synthase
LSRLVVVSNRVAPIDEGQAAVGGLAVAVLAALRETGGVWFGWSGETAAERQMTPTLTEQGGLTFATVDLTKRDIDEYYLGYANNVLWPLLHYRLDLTRFERRNFLGYMRVNDRLARMLQPMLRPDDTIWVHDYHLIPLARALRQSGVRNRIGFFLHTPFPPPDILEALPRHVDILRALCDYDLVGFQTQSDLSSFRASVETLVGGTLRDDGTLLAFGRSVRSDAFPIGLDAENVRRLAQRHDRSRVRQRLREVLHERSMIIGVDRLDYSKGLIGRFEAYRDLLDVNEDLHGKVTLMQIAPPSRADAYGYGEIRTELENLTGNINGRFADFDWVPLRYLNRSFSRDMLTCFYREAEVGLVTPLRDGMNLVAKEYVASQNPENPGVLVLSQFAGAAAQMSDALIVNPYDHDEIANALYRALHMPLRERRKRWRNMMDGLVSEDIHHWRKAFLGALADAVPA